MTTVPYFINFESIHTLKDNFTKCYCHIYRTHKQTNKHTKHAFKLLVKWRCAKMIGLVCRVFYWKLLSGFSLNWKSLILVPLTKAWLPHETQHAYIVLYTMRKQPWSHEKQVKRSIKRHLSSFKYIFLLKSLIIIF